MAKSISGTKNFPGIRRTSLDDSSKFGLPSRTRCAQCLKFQANDPSKVGEDEFGKLLRCSSCKKVYYCSKVCAEKNYPYHKMHCKVLENPYLVSLTPDYFHHIKYTPNMMKDLFIGQYMTSSTIYQTAIMGQDRKLCEVYLDFAAKTSKFLNSIEKNCGHDTVVGAAKHGYCNSSIQLNIDAHCNVILLCLGRDQEAYEFLKYSTLHFGLKDANFELFKNIPKNNERSCKEKFFAMDFFKGLLYATKNDQCH